MVTQVARWVVRWEIGWLLLIAPFLFFPSPTRALALLVIPLLWGARWVATRHFVPPTPLDWSLVLLLGMVLVSLWATFDPLFSLPKVTGVVLGVAFFYALVARVQRGAPTWESLIALILVSCGIAVGGLLGTQWTNKFPLLSAVTDRLPLLIRSVPGNPTEGFNPNGVAGALLFALPLLVALLWHYRNNSLPVRGAWQRGARVFLWLSFLLIALTFLLTQSRNGYISITAGLVALLSLPRRRVAILAGGTLLLLILAFATGALSFPSALEDTKGSNLSAIEGGIDSFQDRQEIWLRALYAIGDFPITGMGMGTFRRVVPLLYPLFTIAPDTDIGHPHNHLLAAAVDLGLPGLIAYLALWVGCGVMAWQSWHLASASSEKILALGLIAGLIAHFIWGLADSNVLGSKAGVVFWFSLAALTSLHQAVVMSRMAPSEGNHDG